MLLCNQGCGTRVYIKDGKVYNVSDNELHKNSCMSLKIGKWWAGQEDTIPIRRIKAEIEECYRLAIRGDRLTLEEMLDLIHTIQSNMEYVMRQLNDQEKWNALQKAEFAVYKTNLVAAQTLRRERKKVVNITENPFPKADGLAAEAGEEE